MKNKNRYVGREVHEIIITMLPTYDFPSDKDVLSLLKKLGSLVCATAQTKLPSKSPPFVFHGVVLYFKGHPSIIIPLSILSLLLCAP